MVVYHLGMANFRVLHIAHDGRMVRTKADVGVQCDSDADVHENRSVAGNQRITAANAKKGAPFGFFCLARFVILGTLEFGVGTYGERERHEDRCQKFCFHSPSVFPSHLQFFVLTAGQWQIVHTRLLPHKMMDQTPKSRKRNSGIKASDP